MDIAVLSPHLDDAALSLGGLIGREAAAGHDVEVVTCFTAGPPLDTVPAKRRVFADYTARRETNAPFRLWVHPTAGSTCGNGPSGIRRCPVHYRPSAPHRTWGTFAELTTIRELIGELLDRGVLVYAPLGVGNHVDHVEVALAAISEMVESKAFSRLCFYEDSYAMSRLPRRRHLVARRHIWPRFGGPAFASPRIGIMLLLIGLSACGPRLDGYLPETGRLAWTSEPAPLSPRR